jgi:arginyl-tRNA synthetase
MNINTQIVQCTVDAVRHIYGQETDAAAITVQDTRKEFEGQLTVVTFPFTKFSKQSPEQTGAAIGDYLRKDQRDRSL